MAAAKKAEAQERVIALLGGDSGVGKSFFIANLKRARIYDTDLGGGLSYADTRIRKNGSVRIEVGSYPEIIEDIQKHKADLKNFTTLAIDHLTTLQQEAVVRYNPSFAEGTFGKEHDRATKEWRKIRDLVRWGDYNLFCSAHMKNDYKNKVVVGLVTDASKNINGDFHVVLHVLPGQGPPTAATPSIAKVVKWRRDPEDERGLIPPTFPFTMDEFLRINGSSLDGVRIEIPMATPELVAELTRLIEVVKLPDDLIGKWKLKAKADSFDEFSLEIITKCVEYTRNLVNNPPTKPAA